VIRLQFDAIISGLVNIHIEMKNCIDLALYGLVSRVGYSSFSRPTVIFVSQGHTCAFSCAC
jgi:hypothetical protein